MDGSRRVDDSGEEEFRLRRTPLPLDLPGEANAAIGGKLPVGHDPFVAQADEEFSGAGRSPCGILPSTSGERYDLHTLSYLGQAEFTRFDQRARCLDEP